MSSDSTQWQNKAPTEFVEHGDPSPHSNFLSSSLVEGTVPVPFPGSLPTRSQTPKPGNKNANERARRDCLNAHLRDLARCIPALQNVRRPSKTLILERAVGFFDEIQKRLNELERENFLLSQEIEHLKSVIGSALSLRDNGSRGTEELRLPPSPPFVEPSSSLNETEEYCSPTIRNALLFTPTSSSSSAPAAECDFYATPSPSDFSPPSVALTPIPCALQDESFAEPQSSVPIWCQMSMPFSCVSQDPDPFRSVPFPQEMLSFPTTTSTCSSEETTRLLDSMKMDTIVSMEEMSLDGILLDGGGMDHNAGQGAAVIAAGSEGNAPKMIWT